MARSPPRNITAIRGTGQADATVVWRILECTRPGCDHLHKISEDTEGFPDIMVTCAKCGKVTGRDHFLRAPRWKYCRVCEWLQPIGETISRTRSTRGKTIGSAFHYHKPNSRSFRSERQLECKACKREINRVLNPLRTSDQHRESAQRRRMYALVAGEAGKLDSKAVFERFGGKCFNCSKRLTWAKRGAKDLVIDHTLPIYYLWPVTTESATLLCKGCNAEKSDRWPSEYYSRSKLQRLAVLTGIPLGVLRGPPILNPEAVRLIRANVDAFLETWIKYPAEIRRIRELIHEMEGVDIKEEATTWPSFLD